MVHISEVANTYVNDIHDHLTEGQDIKVRVIGINEQGKVSLSIKKAVEGGEAQSRPQQRRNNSGSGKEQRGKPVIWEPKRPVPQSEMSFEDMMSHFKQSSEERIGDLKRSTDRKNGTRRK